MGDGYGRGTLPWMGQGQDEPLASGQCGRLRRALATMSDVNQWLGQHDGHVEAVRLGQAMRDVRWVLVGLEGGQDE